MLTNTNTKKLMLEYEPLHLNGQLTYRIIANFNGEPLHMDSINIASDRARTLFLRKLAEKAEQANCPCDLQEIEKSLLGLAANATLGIDQLHLTTCQNRTSSPQERLDAFGIDVLGEREDQSVLLWIKATGKHFVIKNVANFRTHDLFQAVGEASAAILWLGDEEKCPEGKYSMFALQQAIAFAAAKAPRIQSSNILGQGVWSAPSGVLIVDGDTARLYDGTKLLRLRRPRYGKKVIELDFSKKWHGNLPALITGMNVDGTRKLINRLVALLRHWNWTHEWDARLVAALAIATFIQSCWQWRPLVSIIGPSDSGKSTLLNELLVTMFLEWSICADRSTEAGLRQAIGNDSSPVIVDEFDKYKQRQQVLELFRTSSRGGKILRGTADQSGQQFGVKHLAWFASIESGDIWGQDRNRFIRLELQPPETRGTLSLPAPTELKELGLQLAAAAIWAVRAAVPLANAIKSTRIDGVHGRIIESFSVPAAMFAVMWHGRKVSIEQARRILQLMLEGRGTIQEQGEPDERRLLNDIFSANIRVADRISGGSVSRELSVGQLLLDKNQKFADELKAKGIAIIARRGRPRHELFLADDLIRQQLLANTRWKDSRIDQILMRLPNARREQQRCGGPRYSGIALPWPNCLGDSTAQDNQQDSETSGE